MLFKALAASSLLVAVAVATPGPAPYRIGIMSTNPAFGLARRQAGYQPTQTQCGSGDTCAEACGAGYVQCPSSDDIMHCYDPDIKDTCCPDGTGNSCSVGYFCTKDTSGDTWCCPDGMSLAECAAAYSLTGTLASEAATSAPTPVGTGTAPTTTAPAPVIPTTTAVGTLSPTHVPTNGTVTAPTITTSAPPQFTGGASANGVGGGLLALGIAGVLAAL